MKPITGPVRGSQAREEFKHFIHHGVSMNLRLATANENGGRLSNARNRRGGPMWPPEPPTQARPYGFTDGKGELNFHLVSQDHPVEELTPERLATNVTNHSKEFRGIRDTAPEILAF